MLKEDGVAVVGEASSGERAIALARELTPDAVVIDLKMPTVSGVEAIREIAAASPEVRIVVLTVSADESDVIDALAAGADGYMLKDAPPEELLSGIRLVARGHAVLSSKVVQALAHTYIDSKVADEARNKQPHLTARELEVIRLIAAGTDNAKIGEELALSRHTVKQYVTNIFEKLGVTSRVEAAVYAVRNGLV
jgi:DNA-binding NarL/FixJ family response regulator